MNKLTEAFNRVIDENPDLAVLFGGGQARYRYFDDKNKNQYFYTVEKIMHKGELRYVAGIYRNIKTKNQLKLVKRVGFAKKKRAIAWALKERDKSNKKITNQK